MKQGGLEKAAPEGSSEQDERHQWLQASVSRRGFMLGAGLIGAGGLALGTAAGRWMIPAAHASTPVASAPTPSGVLTEATAIADRSFVSSKLTTAHATSWKAGHTSKGLLFVAPQGHGSNGLIMDDDGVPVWIEPTGVGVMGLRMQEFEGNPVLTYWTGIGVGGHGEGVGTILDTSYRKVAQVNTGNGMKADLHEFRLTDTGTALLTSYPTVRQDLSSLGGPVDGYMYNCHVQEVNVRSGKVLLDWNAMDVIGLDESYLQPSGTADGTSATKAFDPYHVNSVDYEAGTLLVSARHTHALYQLDQATGVVQWRLGGKHSDFAVASNAVFAWQHDALRLSPTEISVFDNHYESGTTGTSRGLFLTIDETARTAVLKSEFANAGHRGNSQGNVQVLPNGNILVGWGSDPAATEFTADGTAIYETVGLGNASYRVFRYPWTATPVTVPDVGVLPGNGSSMAVFVSWNGATNVEKWRISTGDDEKTLAVGPTIPRCGFETQIAVANASHVMVEALDSGGAVLSRSAVIKV